MIIRGPALFATVSSVLVLGLSISAVACCEITIGNQRVTCAEVCTDEQTACRAPGDVAVVMPRDRPLFGGDPKKYLGKLALTANVRRPLDSCFSPMADSDYQGREVKLHVTLVKETTIEAKVSAAVDAALASSGVDDLPRAKAAVTASVASKLKEKNYTEASYNVYALNDDFFERIKNAPTGSPEARCREKLSAAPDYGFIAGIAVITAESKLSSALQEEIKTVVTASLENFKIGNGAVGPAVSASLAISIASRVERDVEQEAARYTSVYSYGFWKDPFGGPGKPSEMKALALKANSHIELFGVKLKVEDLKLNAVPVRTPPAPSQPVPQPPAPEISAPQAPAPQPVVPQNPAPPLVSSQECHQRCDELCRRHRGSSSEGHFCSDSGVGRQACLYGDPGVNRPRCNDAAFLAQ